MTYPKRIEWHGGSSGHPESRTRVSQRALVEASLLRCPPRDPLP